MLKEGLEDTLLSFLSKGQDVGCGRSLCTFPRPLILRTTLPGLSHPIV
jgi:hypothetical protein